MVDLELQSNTLPYNVASSSLRSSNQMLDFNHIEWKR